MNMTASNNFLKFLALGYTRLVPVVPPDAEISERSSLSRALNTSKDPRGKAVGIKGRDGKWFGYDWVRYENDEEDLARWHKMGAGVGIKTGNGLVLIDADTTNTEYARIIRDQLSLLGHLPPVRVGQYPKAGYVVRTDPDFQYTRIEFGERNDKGYLTERVEILAEGRQFVAHGVHPKTGKLYEWPKGIPAFKDLPFISGPMLKIFLESLKPLLPQASDPIREGAAQANIAQDSLRGSLDAVRAAVRATPNTSALFPSRESYRDYGYAIKAALPDNAQEAFDLFADWCDRWTDGTNDQDVVTSDWRRMKPPFKRGASWLYELAEQHSSGLFKAADAWFEILPDQTENPFAQIEDRKQTSEHYRLLSMDDIENRPPPTWLIERHIPERSVGFLYSEPGAGKSFVALDMALTIAYGRPEWHGDKVTSDNAAVIYIAAEGSYGFRNRIRAWRRKHDVKETSQRFRMIEQTVNFMSGDDITRLLKTLQAYQDASGTRPAFVIVDTVSRALPGADENVQKDMTLFVKACDAIRDAHGCAVMGVHHSNKQGAMRGSTVLLGAGDYVFGLDRKKGAAIGALLCEKQKDGPDGWTENYRFDVVSLEDGETSIVVERAEGSFGPAVALTPDVSARVLGAMRAAYEGGEPWSKAPQAKERYAVRRMVVDYGFDGVKAEETLLFWEASGLISWAVVDSKRKIKGYKVAGEIVQDVQNEDIFA